MSHYDEDDCIVSKDRERVRDHYRWQFPLLAAYQDITSEHNYVPGRSINDPTSSPDEVNTMQAAAMALERVGKPPRDRQDILMAEAYMRRLEDEINALAPIKRALPDQVVYALYPLAGCMPTAEDWRGYSVEDRYDFLDEVMGSIQDDDLRPMLKEALDFAMAEILEFISSEDQAWRIR